MARVSASVVRRKVSGESGHPCGMHPDRTEGVHARRKSKGGKTKHTKEGRAKGERLPFGRNIT
eukprot:scaffold194933_cov28-Tisochrysis_lutea.AAC.1